MDRFVQCVLSSSDYSYLVDSSPAKLAGTGVLMAARSLTLGEVVQLVQNSDEEDFELTSDDDEDLVGDFVGSNGRPGLFTETPSADDADDYEPVSLRFGTGIDPCYRPSLLDLDEELTEVCEYPPTVG